MNDLGLAPEELWVIATCMVCGLACAIPGVFLMLSRSSLLADGIAHATLAGIGMAFLIFKSRNPALLAGGAFCAGLITVFLIVGIQKTRVLKSDTALGVVFTSLFALGVVIISTVAHDVDLDPGCVLYGLAEFVPFDSRNIYGIEVPKAFLSLTTVLCATVIGYTLFWKELVITTFDPVVAKIQGVPALAVRLIFLVSVTITVVVSFEVVGSILVVALLVAPAIGASMLSRSLIGITLLSGFLAVVAAPIGYLSALHTNTPVASMMGITLGIMCALAITLAPSRGLVSLAIRRALLRLRITEDDILGILFRWHETSSKIPTIPIKPTFIKSALQSKTPASIALRTLQWKGSILVARDSSLRLTEQGLVEAKALIRSHRLWETYLAKHLGLAPDHLHEPSERTEHYIGRALARDIAEEVASDTDPHGRDIPS